jgi:hypothetical protein
LRFGHKDRLYRVLVSGFKEGRWAFTRQGTRGVWGTSPTLGNGLCVPNATVFLADVWLFAITQPTDCETLPMWKLPTGEPYARKLPVRFAGRGRRQPLPIPIGKKEAASALSPSRRRRPGP